MANPFSAFSKKFQKVAPPSAPPSPEQLEQAAAAVGSFRQVLVDGANKAMVLTNKDEGVLVYTTLHGGALEQILQYGLPQFVKSILRTNRSLLRHARDLQQHPDADVQAAAKAVVQYCKKHPGWQSNTAELSRKVFALHHAIRLSRLAAMEMQMDDIPAFPETTKTSTNVPYPTRPTLAPLQSTLASAVAHVELPQKAGRAQADREAIHLVRNNAGHASDEVHKSAGNGRFQEPMTVKFMFASLTHYMAQGHEGQSVGIGAGKNMVFVHPASADNIHPNDDRQFALTVQAMGRMYAEFPHGEIVRNAGQTLMAMAAPVLDDTNPAQSITLSQELVDALFVICNQCADLYDREDLPVKQFYREQADKIELSAKTPQRYQSISELQKAARREASANQDRDYTELDPNMAACMYMHLYWRASLHQDDNQIAPDAPQYYVQYTGDKAPSLASKIQEGEIFGEPRVVVNGDPAQKYIEIVQAFGRAYLTDKNAKVVAHARSLLAIANEANVRQQPIHNSQELQDAFGHIALYGTATLA
jgi:hypothetical protein